MMLDEEAADTRWVPVAPSRTASSVPQAASCASGGSAAPAESVAVWSTVVAFAMERHEPPRRRAAGACRESRIRRARIGRMKRRCSRRTSHTRRAPFPIGVRNLRAETEMPLSHRRQQLGGMLARLGRKSEARAHREKAFALARATGDVNMTAYIRQDLANTYILIGDYDAALARLDTMLRSPSRMNPGRLREGFDFAPLRRAPRFERLLTARELMAPVSPSD